METKLIAISAKCPTKDKIKLVADTLKSGNVVAFPTETVYGLGANALDEEAVKKIYIAKGRPSDNPLIVHIGNINQLNVLVKSIPKKAQLLINKFWPGPLTIVLKKKSIVPDITSAGLDTVGIRMPSHPIFLEIIKKCDFPIAAPSANSFSKPSPTTAKDVFEDMNRRISLIVNGGKCKVGIESTIIDLSKEKPVLLRPGGISKEDIEHLIGKIEIHPSISDPLTKVRVAESPGMKYKHYSPNAKVIIAKTLDSADNFIRKSKSKMIYYIGTKDINAPVQKKTILKNDVALTRSIFSSFREADRLSVDFIVVLSIEEKGIGLGLMNRLKKAASKIV